MLEIKRFVFPHASQWYDVVLGCRNAYKSNERFDSCVVPRGFSKCRTCPDDVTEPFFKIGKEDKGLLKRLCNAQKGEPSHSKFLRQLPIILTIRAPLFWWKQMDKYQVGTVTNSESTMHTITKYPFSLDDFSLDNSLDRNWRSYDDGDILDCYNFPVDADLYIIESTLLILNELRDEYLGIKHYKEEFNKAARGEIIDPNTRRIFAWRYFEENEDFFDGKTDKEMVGVAKKMMDRVWYALIELLPESYMQTRTWSANYEVLRKIVKQRTGHPLDGEWGVFIDWIRENVPMAKELIFNEWPKEEENE